MDYNLAMRHPLKIIGNHLSRSFGGKKAFIATGFHGVRYYCGAFHDYIHVDWRRVSRMIFVCKGNICRSPFAEYRLRALGASAISAGLDAECGKPANECAANVAKGLGVDLAPHLSTNVSELELFDGDLIVAFEPKHADILRKLFAHQPAVQVTLLGLWSPTPWMVYLHDPYGLSEAYFNTCFERIERSMLGLWERWSEPSNQRKEKNEKLAL